MNTCIEFVLGVDIVSILPRNKNTLEFFYNLVCLKVCFFLLRWVGQLVVHILHEQPVRLQLYAESVSDVRPHFQLDYPSLSSLKRSPVDVLFSPLYRIVCPYVEGVYWKVLTIVNGEILSRTLVCLPNWWLRCRC